MQIVQGQVALAVSQGFLWGDVRTAAAGQFTTIQLFNPSGSGVTIVTRAIAVATNVTQEFYVEQFDTENAVGTTGRNLRSGGAASQGRVNSTSQGVQQGSAFLFLELPADTSIILPSSFSFVLPEERGLIVVANVAATRLSAFFVWEEQ